MKTARLLLLAAASVAHAFAGYVYDFPSLLNPYNSGQWASTGSISASTNMFTSSDANGGALIFNNTVPAPSNSYEIRTTLTLTASGGNYITYLRASYGSLLASGNGGTFYAIEVANPTISGNTCSATLNVFKQTGANTLSNPYSNAIYCHNGMVVRAVVIQANVVAVYIDNRFYTSWGWNDGSPIVSGQPGVGVSGAPSGNGISAIDIGHLDTVAPNPLNVQQVGTGSYPNHVDIQFPGAVDDANGTGIAYYQFFRCTGTSCSLNWLDITTTPQFADTTVQAGTTYTYELQAVDYHYNTTSINITVTTPPAGAIDPRQVGVRSLGTYWGGGGEQLDMRSGNLNYTIPLLKAMARGGWGVGFSLSYNSQNWRQDSGGTWQLGRDIGYGYGWKMQAGSLTPVYADYWDVDHYLFIDSTGAEYRLNVNTNGVWTSKEGIYVYYDSNAGRLYFRDGSFWVLGSLSAGTEQDAGTMYPTQMEDANGNQINIAYNSGAGVAWINSSSRVNTITDVRLAGQMTYNFSYTTINIQDQIPHLTGISNHVGTAENYAFWYISGYNLTSPFAGGASYGTSTMMQCVSGQTIPDLTNFAFDGAGVQTCGSGTGTGPGELTQMTTSGGGHLRWAYGSTTYAGTRTQREVQNRYLLMASSGTELAYPISHTSDPSGSIHFAGAVYDAAGLGLKAWGFQTDTSQNDYGLLFEYFFYPNVSTSTGVHAEGYGWSADPAGNLYISQVYDQESINTSAVVVKQTLQTLDQYGNMTQMQLYNFGAPGAGVGSLARTYTNTYLNNSNYTSRYIFNRLASSTLTDGSNTTTLVQNSYDQNTYADVSNITMHDSNYGTGFQYRGDLTTSTSPGGTRTAYYDIGGNAISTTTNGVTTNVSTNLSTNWAAPATISTNSLTSSMIWDTALNLTSASGPNTGDTTSIDYGGISGRPFRTTAPTGSITDYAYADGVNPSVTATTCPIAGYLPFTTCPVTPHWVKTIKDGFGRTVETDTGYGSTTVSIVTTSYAPCGCSPLGKMSQVSEPYAPGGSPVYTTYHYDGMGRTTSVVAPDGSTTRYSYAGNTVTVTDPSGRWKTFSMDAFGNLTQVSEPSAPAGSGGATTATADSVAPASGSGASQTFAVQYSDTAGASSLQYVYVYVNATLANPASNSCLLYYGVAANQIQLLNDNGTTWQTATPGAATTLQNSQCSLNVAATSVALSGNRLTMNLAMTFLPAYAGAKYIYMYAADASGNSGWQQLGTWTASTSGQGGGGVIAPTFSPAPGIYNSGQSITITTSTSGATIRYTLDGTIPTETTGTVYTGPFYLGATQTLTAIAYKSGLTDSPLAVGVYTIQIWGGTPYVTSYNYDMLNHLTGVIMPRGGTTQTRAFNYTSGSTVGALLLRATNPENGTVTYTYNTDMTLATKTDAKGQVFTYQYDSYKRVKSISVGGTLLRTYVYDTNPDDPSYSQNTAAGRLTEIKYPAINYNDGSGNAASTTFTDMFSYTAAGQISGKRLRVAKSQSQPSQNATGDLNLVYAYDGEGKLTQVTYPTDGQSNTTPSYSYTYDQMMRLTGATDLNSVPIVNGVQYNAANQLTNIHYYTATETRTYNSLFQLSNISTTVQGGAGINLTYNYTGGANNGKIASMTDAISVETVTYQYDSLNRLISASTGNGGWTQTMTYDGFGNLIARNGAGALSTPTDAATNRLSATAGYAYDANGNLLSTGYTYDSENRIVFANAGVVEYFYDAQNKRIWQGNCNPQLYFCPGTISSDLVTLFGADGKLIATYQPIPSQSTISFYMTQERSYFGGKLVGQLTGQAGSMQAAVQDRLGSVGKYYPYGEERNTPQLTPDQVKFATYTRDSATGLDYADQRFYASTLGRFMTPDRLGGGPTEPGSWNRYAYTRGDPINRTDIRGLCDSDFCITVTGSADDSGSGGDGGLLGGGGCNSSDPEECSGLLLGNQSPNGESGPFVSLAVTYRVPGTNVTVTNPAGSLTVDRAIRSLEDALASDSKCEHWLETSAKAPTDALLRSFFESERSKSGSADISDRDVAALSNTGAYVPGFDLIVNRVGSFFNGSGVAGLFSSYTGITNINDNTDRFREFILLHELTHILGVPGFANNDASDSAQRKNNDQLWENCQKTIASFGN